MMKTIAGRISVRFVGRGHAAGNHLPGHIFVIRPFFFLSGVWASVAVGLWSGHLSGFLDLGLSDALAWHVHEMMFGFVAAAVGVGRDRHVELGELWVGVAPNDTHRVHTDALELGAVIVHPPQQDGFAPGYYSVLFEDPDGIRIEVNYVPGKGHFGDKGRLSQDGPGPSDKYGEEGL